MNRRKRIVATDEIRRVFDTDVWALRFPPILTTEQVLAMLQVPRSTFDLWKAKGYFDGSYRKRGKRVRFMRDKVIESFFNGPGAK